MPDPKQVWLDPKFNGLPPAARKIVMSRIDPNFAELPPAAQDQVIQGAQEKYTESQSKGAAHIGPTPLGQRLTQLWEPNPKESSLQQVGTAAGDIGAGALGVILHPINTAEGVASTFLHPEESASQLGDQLRTSPVSTIMGMIGQTPVMDAAAEFGPRVPVGELGKAAGRMISGTGAKVAKDLSDKVVKDNADIALRNKDKFAEHQDKVREADHETRGKEIQYQMDLAKKKAEIERQDALEAEKLKQGHADEARKIKEKNDQDKEKYNSEVKKIQDHNDRIKAKHAVESQRIQQENDALDHTLGLRRSREAQLQKATEEYHAAEDAKDAEAKQVENQAWSQWRGKMDGLTMDGSEITAPLARLRLDSPEVDRALRQLEPKGDEVPQESDYKRLQDQTAVQNTGRHYDELSPNTQAAIDSALQAMGHAPEPIDFDPQEGQPISVERVHRANSILQRYLRSGRFEGPLRGEMIQVSKVLRRAVSKASEDHGAGDDLDNARAQTVKYNEAFGKERPEPRTVKGEREKVANPEEVKRLQEEERLAAVAKYDPDLADKQRQVKTLHDQVKKMPSEDQLRKLRKQVPAPPTIGDVRDGYNLREEPAPFVAKHAVSKFAPRPPAESAEERAFVEVPQVVKTPGPRPFVPDESKTITPESLREAKLKALDNRIKSMNHWVGLIVRWGVAYKVLESVSHGEFDDVPRDILAGGVALGGEHIFTRLLKNSAIEKILTEPTPRDLQMMNPEIAQGFGDVIKKAQQHGVKVSPKLIAAVVAASSAKHPPHPVLSSQSPVQPKSSVYP